MQDITIVNSPQFYQGIASAPFASEVQRKLMRTLKDEEIEIRPDGNLYFPEVKYRRVLIDAFGAGGWALVPVTRTDISNVHVCFFLACFYITGSG